MLPFIVVVMTAMVPWSTQFKPELSHVLRLACIPPQIQRSFSWLRKDSLACVPLCDIFFGLDLHVQVHSKLC